MTSSYVVCDVDEALDVLGLRVSGESREEEDDGAGVVAVGHGRLLGLLLAPVQGDLAAVGEEDHLERGSKEETCTTTTTPTVPNHQRRWHNGGSAGIGTRRVHVFIARLAPTCVLGRCLVKKISASELSRNFVKSALLVG